MLTQHTFTNAYTHINTHSTETHTTPYSHTNIHVLSLSPMAEACRNLRSLAGRCFPLGKKTWWALIPGSRCPSHPTHLLFVAFQFSDPKTTDQALTPVPRGRSVEGLAWMEMGGLHNQEMGSQPPPHTLICIPHITTAQELQVINFCWERVCFLLGSFFCRHCVLFLQWLQSLQYNLGINYSPISRE